MTSAKQIVITTGDADGIGLEVTLKSLIKLKPLRGVRFAFFRDPKVRSSLLKTLGRHFEVQTIASLKELPVRSQSNQIFQILESSDPTQWFKDTCEYCLATNNSAVVTGPLSKLGMRKFGHQDLGHTDILKKICNTDFVYQTYLGSKFNILLVTDHIPLSAVSDELLNTLKFSNALTAAVEIKQKLGLSGRIALLGLNPHAGETGLIGEEESELLRRVQEIDPKRRSFTDFIPADSAFMPLNFKKYSLFIALYHDQGLIPFKSIHGFDEGVHLTSGIPFVRTSVDHGTAKELFGKNKANFGSMLHAIKSAVTLLRK